MPTESMANGAAAVKEIRGYRDAIGRVRCRLGYCPLCGAKAWNAAFFRRHEIRERVFWVVERVVEKVWGCVTRWKCRGCGRTFTLQPAFALPRKRYVLAEVWERVERYVTKAGVSYECAVKDAEGMPVCHDVAAEKLAEACGNETKEDAATCVEKAKEVSGCAEEEEEDAEQDDGTGRQLRGSTLYRWVTTLGGLGETGRRALDLVKQKYPATGLVRELAGVRVACGKFRSEGREKVLLACRRLLVIVREYEDKLKAKVFPMLATAVGWA